MSNTKVQEELVKSANLIRQKYRALKRGKFIDEEQRLETLKPLTEPLEKLVSNKEVAPQQAISPYTRFPGTPRALTPSKIPALQYRPPPMTLEFGRLATKYLANYLHPNEKRGRSADTTFGLRKDPDSNDFLIGNSKVEIATDDITIGDKTYKGTEGLWSLLTLKEPDTKLVTDDDMESYKEILEQTSAHRQGYQSDAKVASSSGRKYMNIIKPLFSKSGFGLLHKKEVTNNKIDYVYWDDPNELVNRLRLLILSRDAGNTGVLNEIESIMEELRESGIIVK